MGFFKTAWKNLQNLSQRSGNVPQDFDPQILAREILYNSNSPLYLATSRKADPHLADVAGDGDVDGQGRGAVLLQVRAGWACAVQLSPILRGKECGAGAGCGSFRNLLGEIIHPFSPGTL